MSEDPWPRVAAMPDADQFAASLKRGIADAAAGKVVRRDDFLSEPGPEIFVPDQAGRTLRSQSLSDFLLARIAEDETDAEGWPDEDWGPRDRRLAECEAKRQIIAEHAQWLWPNHPGLHAGVCRACATPIEPVAESSAGLSESREWPCPTLKFLALPYADHPDYRDEWKP